VEDALRRRIQPYLELARLLKESLGAFTLEQLAGNPLLIERWLNEAQKTRGCATQNAASGRTR
jgi:hypothetical protein